MQTCNVRGIAYSEVRYLAMFLVCEHSVILLIKEIGFSSTVEYLHSGLVHQGADWYCAFYLDLINCQKRFPIDGFLSSASVLSMPRILSSGLCSIILRLAVFLTSVYFFKLSVKFLVFYCIASLLSLSDQYSLIDWFIQGTCCFPLMVFCMLSATYLMQPVWWFVWFLPFRNVQLSSPWHSGLMFSSLLVIVLSISSFMLMIQLLRPIFPNSPGILLGTFSILLYNVHIGLLIYVYSSWFFLV